VQTFLPYASFERSAQVLDQARLGKQRVEVLQVLRALELPDYGWANHPAVLMWRGRTPALVVYGLTCVRAWTARGHADSTAPQIAEFAPEAAGLDQEALRRAGLLPSWLGDGALHLSHRSALLRKDPARYRAVFGDVPDDLPYLWPGPDDLPPPPPLPADADAGGPGGARPLWVVRAPDAAALGAFVGEGVVGLDASSGVDVDALALRAHPEDEPPPEAAPARGRRAAATGAAAGAKPPGSRRRGGKAARQLAAFLDDLAPGDDVATPVARESALLLGTVVGGYAFRAGPPGAVVHRRPVAWREVVPRAAVQRPHLLQDPRALFRVAAGARPAAGPATAGADRLAHDVLTS
jgi:hypothetical protein